MAELTVDAQKPSYDVGYLMQGAITHVPLTPVHWGAIGWRHSNIFNPDAVLRANFDATLTQEAAFHTEAQLGSEVSLLLGVDADLDEPSYPEVFGLSMHPVVQTVRPNIVGLSIHPIGVSSLIRYGAIDFPVELDASTRTQARVKYEAEMELQTDAQAAQGGVAIFESDLGVIFEMGGRARLVPTVVDNDSGLAWTFVQNAVEYEVERAVGSEEGELVYTGVGVSDFVFQDYTINSSYRVRAVNEYGAGPWSAPFTVAAKESYIVTESRYLALGERDSFVFVQVASFGGGRKARSDGAEAMVAVQSSGGGEREGVEAGAAILVNSGGGATAAHSGGAGAGVMVAPEGGFHRGAIITLVASGEFESFAVARFALEQVAVVTRTSGRVRRRRVR